MKELAYFQEVASAEELRKRIFYSVNNKKTDACEKDGSNCFCRSRVQMEDISNIYCNFFFD